MLRSASRYKALDETGVFGYCCRHEFPHQFGRTILYSILLFWFNIYILVFVYSFLTKMALILVLVLVNQKCRLQFLFSFSEVTNF